MLWIGSIILVVVAFGNVFLAEHTLASSSLPGQKDTHFPHMYYSQRNSVQEDWPALETLVDGHEVIANVSFLLDFAIVGFPKCGTTSLMKHLQSHPMVQVGQDEHCDLSYNRKAPLVRHLYEELPSGRAYHRGLKCPMDLENNKLALPNYQRYFPQTKFLVGIRHPIRWFESFYNFRIHNEAPMPPAQSLKGRCGKGMFSVCTFRSAYHLYLANLGKTVLDSLERETYFQAKYRRLLKPVANMTKIPIFLYEVTQLSQDPQHPDRLVQFVHDLESFLQLPRRKDNDNDNDNDKNHTSMVWYKPGIQHDTAVQQQKVDRNKIDICEEQYQDLRDDLLQNGKEARAWILEKFLDAPGVVVSSREYLRQVLDTYQHDPCVTTTK